jgi:hypothetical protein
MNSSIDMQKYGILVDACLSGCRTQPLYLYQVGRGLTHPHTRRPAPEGGYPRDAAVLLLGATRYNVEVPPTPTVQTPSPPRGMDGLTSLCARFALTAGHDVLRRVPPYLASVCLNRIGKPEI